MNPVNKMNVVQHKLTNETALYEGTVKGPYGTLAIFTIHRSGRGREYLELESFWTCWDWAIPSCANCCAISKDLRFDGFWTGYRCQDTDCIPF